jgi:hypothetical protein
MMMGKTHTPNAELNKVSLPYHTIPYSDKTCHSNHTEGKTQFLENTTRVHAPVMARFETSPKSQSFASIVPGMMSTLCDFKSLSARNHGHASMWAHTIMGIRAHAALYANRATALHHRWIMTGLCSCRYSIPRAIPRCTQRATTHDGSQTGRAHASAPRAHRHANSLLI